VGDCLGTAGNIDHEHLLRRDGDAAGHARHHRSHWPLGRSDRRFMADSTAQTWNAQSYRAPRLVDSPSLFTVSEARGGGRSAHDEHGAPDATWAEHDAFARLLLSGTFAARGQPSGNCWVPAR